MKNVRFCLLLLIVCFSSALSAREFHVSVKGSGTGDGSFAKPFKTIGEAVKIAFAGDTITVHAGTYREWVNPSSKTLAITCKKINIALDPISVNVFILNSK